MFSPFSPLFITWKERVLHAEEPILRGCIGTLHPTSLSNLSHYVTQSALHDTRFPPIQMNDLPSLQCTVSFLVEYEVASHVSDWIIGTHGILIEFQHEHRKYSATYLPEVAYEQEWNQDEAIRSLIVKAGFRKVVTVELLNEMKVTRYQSSKQTVTYAEYQQYTRMM